MLKRPPMAFDRRDQWAGFSGQRFVTFWKIVNRLQMTGLRDTCFRGKEAKKFSYGVPNRIKCTTNSGANLDVGSDTQCTRNLSRSKNFSRPLHTT